MVLGLVSQPIIAASVVTQHRIEPIRVGIPAYERIVLFSQDGISGAPKRITTSCECARVLGYRGTPERNTGLEILVQIVPTRDGQFNYGVVAEFGPDRQLEGQIDVTAVGSLEPMPSSAGGTDRIGFTDQVAEGAVVLDVRPVHRFGYAHLPGALSIRRQELRRAARQLGDGFVVVGDGHDDEVLRTEVMALPGYDAERFKVLVGGVRGWRARAGALEGTEIAGTGLVHLRAGEVLECLTDPEVKWVTSPTTASPVGAADLVLPVLTAGATSDPSGQLRHLATHLPSPRAIFIAMEPSTASSLLAEAITNYPGLPVYVVEGGVSALQAEAAFLLRMQSRSTGRQAGGHGQDSVRGGLKSSGARCCGK